MKGFETLARHIPELNTNSGWIQIAAPFLGIFGLTTLYFIFTDQIPTWTIDSQIIVMASGYLILSRFFSKKKLLIEKYGDGAYRQAFGRFALPGLAIIFAAIAHIGYMNGPKFTNPNILMLFTWTGWFFIIVGGSLWVRAAIVFGIDNLTMLYVYFPEEGHMLNSSIYGVIRHPVYGAALRMSIGLALLNAGIYPIVFILILPLGVFGWLRLVEEKELLERIPEYAEYRKRVPAFFPYPKRLPAFFNFLITGK